MSFAPYVCAPLTLIEIRKHTVRLPVRHRLPFILLTDAEETAREVDLAVRQLIDDAYARALEILAGRRGLLDEGARLLLEKETLTPEDFPALAPQVAGGEEAARA